MLGSRSAGSGVAISPAIFVVLSLRSPTGLETVGDHRALAASGGGTPMTAACCGAVAAVTVIGLRTACRLCPKATKIKYG